MDMRARNVYLAVALDGLRKTGMISLAQTLHGHVDFFKLTDAADRYGSRAVGWLRPYGEVFVDMKFDDTPRTVANRVAVYHQAKAALITVHARSDEALAAAAEVVRGSKKPQTRIVAVTELTSGGKSAASRGEVFIKADRAVRANIRCITCPASVLPWIRRERQMAVKTLHCVTPGVRPTCAPDPKGQRDFATPTDIIRAAEGRDVTLVVGSPVLDSRNYGMSPFAMVMKIREEMQAALTQMAA